MNAVELAGALAETAELGDVASFPVQDDDPVIVQAVGDQDPTVGQERHVLRPTEVRLVVSRNALLPERHQQLAAVVREDVDLVEGLVDDPHPALGIVRADSDTVGPGTIRSFAQMIPLAPELFQVAVAVERVETVLPDPAISVAKHVDPDRAGVLRELLRDRVGQPRLSSLGD